MSESTLQRELDEAKTSITVTYWHLFQTTENLLKEIARLSSRNAQLVAENERQCALLAALKQEPAAPRTISGGEASRGLPDHTIAVDRNGDVWGLDKNGWTPLYSYEEDSPEEELREKFGPYTIVHTPEEES